MYQVKENLVYNNTDINTGDRYRLSTFIPYIYSPKDIDAIFKACDELRLCAAHMHSNLFSAPALIRMLYSTGLRIGEALEIKNDNVNLDDNYLRVKDSKNGKERIIPISDSLVSVCKQYVRYRDKLPVGKIKSGYFFITLKGSKCSHQGITKWFKKCLEKAGIPYIGRKLGPRIHDLRRSPLPLSLIWLRLDLIFMLPTDTIQLSGPSIPGRNKPLCQINREYVSGLTQRSKYSLPGRIPKI